MKPGPRTVITGGAGFIGSHLVEKLLALGHSIVCIDNLLTGRRENVERFSNDKRYEFRKHDVTQYINVEGDVDFVLHLASPASPLDYLEYPIKTLKVGSLGTHNSLGLALSKNAVFFISSTSEIYGDPLVNPQPESYWGNVNPVGPRGVYDEAKRFSEALTLAYHRVHGLQVRIARIFNTFGPGMRLRDGRAVPNFITQALTNNDITVYGDGSQTRSLCYIDDMTDGLIKLILSDCNEPVNIGNPEEVSILQLAQEIIEITGSGSGITYEPLPENDPKVRRPDITKAKNMIKWEPSITRKEGIGHTVEYFRDELQTIDNG